MERKNKVSLVAICENNKLISSSLSWICSLSPYDYDAPSPTNSESSSDGSQNKRFKQ
jgi:hypothetical protein